MKKLLPLLTCLVLLSPSLMCCRTVPKPTPEQELKELLQSLPEAIPSPDAGAVEVPGRKVGWIHVTGSISDVGALVFQNALTEIMKKKPEILVVELHTGGGSVDAGFDMTKAIEALTIPTVCLVDGDALSEGIYILQACDVRLMTARSTLMVHEPYIEMRVDTPHLGAAVKRQQALTYVWTQHVARRWKITSKHMREIITIGDWYINSEEAMNLSAVDGVVSTVQEVKDSLTKDLSLPGSIKFPPK